MNYFIKVFILSIFLSQLSFASDKESPSPITLNEVTKKITETTQCKILSAKTEIISDKEIHIIKILTEKGHIQHIKIDAETGEKLDNKPSKDK